jgi:hypothetical protein
MFLTAAISFFSNKSILMKWMLLLLQFFVITSFAQDKIITNNGDTLDCRISTRPWKEKVNTRQYGDKRQNGYAYIVAFFRNDSLRIIQPGEIKGFYSHSHSAGLNGGFYESVVIHTKVSMMFKLQDKTEIAFIRRIYSGEHITLYDFRENDIGDIMLRYLVKKSGDETYHPFYRKKALTTIFSDMPGLITESAVRKFRYRFEDITAIVKEYDKLKKGQ